MKGLERLIKDVKLAAEARLTDVDPSGPDFAVRCEEILKGLAPWTFDWKELANPAIWNVAQQSFPLHEFADFSLTLLRGPNYFLDLYVWNGSDTSIHDHHFAGAFKVLAGEYFQVSFDFHEKARLGAGWHEGELKVTEQRMLKVGDVEDIRLGTDFIHFVLHPVLPAVTLCLRSANLRPSLNSYFLPGMRIARVGKHEMNFERYTQALKCWRETDEAGAVEHLKRCEPAHVFSWVHRFSGKAEVGILPLLAKAYPELELQLKNLEEQVKQTHKNRVRLVSFLRMD